MNPHYLSIDTNHLTVTWNPGTTPPTQQRVQYRCVICNTWTNATPGPEPGTAIIPATPQVHRCKWWTRLGPITALADRIRRRRGLPQSRTIQYRMKGTPK